MLSQQPSCISPSEGYSIARQVMGDAVRLYLNNGGPAVARVYIENLGNEIVKLYDDGNEAYLEAMAAISQAEKAEQQRAEEYQQQQLQKLVLTVMGAVQSDQEPVQTDKQPSETTADATAEEPVTLPEKLATEKALLIWQRLQQDGLIDDRYQPVRLSRTDSAILAEEMAMRLADENDRLLGNIEWKPFEMLWHRNNMKADLNRALKQDKTSGFRDRLRRLFKDIP